MIRVMTRELGGSPLARAALAGSVPQWYAPLPAGVSDWARVADSVAAEFSGGQWLRELLPAIRPSAAAAARLTSAGEPGGLVVTGGQQPGLFGGPLYVLNKAITLLELADALQTATGHPVAPVFWAATDDADFAEASHVAVVRRGKLDTLVMASDSAAGRSMANMPLGDVGEQFARLAEACGSASAGETLGAVRAAYDGGATVGGAYLALLRALLEPLGISVLDASHESVRRAGYATMASALQRAGEISRALVSRSKEIAAAGFRAQVADVPNLALVFETFDDGTRRRIPLAGAAAAARDTVPARLGPNVLLRPVMERQILPTLCYVGGPGEVAYFAQVSAAASAMGLAVPRIAPRWSGTIMEPHVEAVLDRLGATMADFVDPHAMEGRIATAGVSAAVRAAITDLRASLDFNSRRLRDEAQTSDALSRSIGSMRAGVEHRLARLERRYAAAVKQAGSDDLRDVEMVRATLYPGGAPQERILSFIPFLARYGMPVIDAARDHARRHVAAVIKCD